jgi:hypothetical protein
MVGYVNNVETLLAKSMVSTTTDRTRSHCRRHGNGRPCSDEPWTAPGFPACIGKYVKISEPGGGSQLALDNQNIKGKALSDEQYAWWKSYKNIVFIE